MDAMVGVAEAGVVDHGVGVRLKEVDANPVVKAGVADHGVGVRLKEVDAILLVAEAGVVRHGDEM